ncbi:MAG: serine/threonine-protein kinase [Planctomycetota bacterium]
MSADTFDDLIVRCLDRVQEEGTQAIDSICAEHPQHATAIRRRLALLASMGLLPVRDSAPQVPERLGEFRIVDRLGTGGMGIVYLAVDQTLGRQVALKLVRPDHLPFDGARTRFQREVAAVARLNHPGIVPVYRAGEANGIPYFCMEYVQGATLSEVLHAVHNENARLDGDAVLGALQRVCATRAVAVDAAAVQARYGGRSWEAAALVIAGEIGRAIGHAHARGVVHRDIKPSNVMLTAEGRIRVMDFGLAATEGSESITAVGTRLGSLPYMSPEQARGDGSELDERTDVYQLGVVLYELLTLTLPYPAGNTERLLRAVLAGSPTRPRERRPATSWDAETVCLKAMELAPPQRYPNVAAMVRDLDNVLAHRPIEARRPHLWRRTRRWVQRNPTATVGLALGAVLFLIGPSVFAWQVVRARAALQQERDEAVRAKTAAQDAARRALKVLAFQRDMLASGDPEQSGKDTRVRDVADRAALLVADAYRGEPEIEAAVRTTLGTTYHALGMLPQADAQFARAHELLAPLAQSVPDDLLGARVDLGRLRIDQSRLPEAEALLVPARDELRRRLGASHPTTLVADREVVQLRLAQSRLDDALADAQTSWDAARTTLGAEDPSTLDAQAVLAQALYKAGKVDAAVQTYRAVCSIRARSLPAEHPALLRSQCSLATTLWAQHAIPEAMALARSTLAAQERVLDPEHPNLLRTLSLLATLTGEAGDYAEEERIERRLLQARRQVLGPEHEDTLRTLGNLADTLHRQKRTEEALELAIEALRLRQRALGATHWETLSSANSVGTMLLGLGRAPEAEPYLATAVAGARTALSPGHWVTGAFLANHAATLVRLERYAEAETELLEAHSIVDKALGAEHPRTQRVVVDLIELYRKTGQTERERAWQARRAEVPQGK